MLESAKRFVRWVHNEVHIGKLWGATALTLGILIVLAQIFRGSQPYGMLDALASTVLILFFFLFTLALWATLVRFERWQKESPRFQNLLAGITLSGALAVLLYSAIVYPAETVEFFKNEWNNVYNSNPFMHWFFNIIGLLYALLFALIIGSAIFAPIIKRLRKNR